ncbi:MAG: DUF2062 domain-containing protein, partial [Desulfofustis sp.]|nr:DUF2062 domain-containing protein [Desulfofustis sp.]
MNISRTGKYYLLKLLRLGGSPHAIALGASIGVFIGITPTVPLHTIAILVLTLMTRSSFVAGIITSWLVCNPLTYIPQYYLSLVIGNLVTPYHLNWSRIKDVLDMVLADIAFAERMRHLAALGYEAIIVMLAGGT